MFVNYSSLAECKFELYIDTNSFCKKRFFPQLTLRICGPFGKCSILHTRKLLLSEVKIVHSWWRRQPLVSLDLFLKKTWRVSNLVASHKRMMREVLSSGFVNGKKSAWGTRKLLTLFNTVQKQQAIASGLSLTSF